jgi:CMP-N,N'-diacetyllegionaminic acid synthase
LKKNATLIAIIPARGGSKRVIKKNIRLLDGKPLIAYAIEAGLNAPSVSRVIVSTDDREIAAVARQYGAEVPFLRPERLAGDLVSDSPVFNHLIKWLESNEDYLFDFLVNLRCTTPFKTVDDIEGAYSRLLKTEADSVRSVTKIDDVAIHPYWIVKKTGDYLEPFLDGIDRTFYQGKRQLLPVAYRFNGVVDIVKAENVTKNPLNIYGNCMAAYEIPEERAIDIDTELDFKFCEFLFNQKAD